MRVLIDIGHPAHVHFFKHAIALLEQRGHDVLITSRDKECALQLLDELGLTHTPLSTLKKGGLLGLGLELVRRNLALYKVVRRQRPDIMLAIGGVSIAQVGRLTGIPSLVFYDTENAKLQNALTYPFASCVIVPRCYETWLPAKRHVRYPGYHELAYLHPRRFQPDRKLAVEAGLDPQRDNFLLRLVSWQANHDVGEQGMDHTLSLRLVEKLRPLGRLFITSEAPLPEILKPYAYRGRVADIHHLLAFCRMYLGESATMASEAAVLGVPALYIANTGRGYTNEQEARYGLVTNIRRLDWQRIDTEIDKALSLDEQELQRRHRRLQQETLDVAQFIVDCAEDYPGFLEHYRQSRST